MSFWFDPMVQTAGMPGNIGSGLSNAYASAASNANYFNNTNATLAAANAYNPWANSGGGFGVQPAAYAAAGAAYGRNTGYYGDTSGLPPGQAPRPGGLPAYSGGGIGSDAYRGGQEGNYSPEEAASLAAFSYNAPRQYGWDANEGASYPQYTPPHQMGMFNPQTYGWDHNEGAVYTPPAQPNWNDLWKSRIAPQVPTFPSSVTVPQQQSGGFGMNLAGVGLAPSIFNARGGYDVGAQSRSYQSPLQGFDWGQSYGTAGGANANMLRTAGGASSGYYNPQLDWLSRSTLGMNNQPVDYSHMFGAPSSGYLGSQGRLNQDPFSAYVNPRDLDAGGSFPGNYQPGYSTNQQGFTWGSL